MRATELLTSAFSYSSHFQIPCDNLGPDFLHENTERHFYAHAPFSRSFHFAKKQLAKCDETRRGTAGSERVPATHERATSRCAVQA